MASSILVSAEAWSLPPATRASSFMRSGLVLLMMVAKVDGMLLGVLFSMMRLCLSGRMSFDDYCFFC